MKKGRLEKDKRNGEKNKEKERKVKERKDGRKMKGAVWVNKGLEETALEEIKELIGAKGKVGGGVVEFEAERKEEIIKLCLRGQSFRRVMVVWGKNSELKKIELSEVRWEDYFSSGFSFKIEVLGVKGNEKRIEISKEITEKIFSSLKEKRLEFGLKIDYKKPDLVVLVCRKGENREGGEFLVGADLGGGELDKRHYRLFPHQASLRGDLGYYLVRKSGFKRGEKLLVGLVKDGTLAIEGALFNSGKTVNKNYLFFRNLPLFKEGGFDLDDFQDKKRGEVKEEVKEKKVYGFDESMMNVRAAKKNAKIAGVEEELEISRFDLDELDVRFKEREIDRLIFQVTRKDEERLNEIYYLAKYVLRKKGVLLMAGRESWEASVPEKFKLVEEEILRKGESGWKVLVMEKR